MTIPARFRILVPAAVSIVGGCLLVALVSPHHYEHVAIGFLLGTLFGQSTLAAAWNVLGPLPLIWRLPLSIVWLIALVMAFAINITVSGPGPDAAFLVVTSLCLFAQWLIVQVPLWGVAIFYGWRLRYRDDDVETFGRRQRQFGIGQLMILTAIVAVVLGIGRLVLARLPQNLNLMSPDTFILIFLGVAAILMTLPLLVATLLPRFAIPATIAIAVLIGLATFGELPLLKQFHRGGGPDVLHLVWINFFTSAWIVAFVLAVRLSGYGVGRPVKTLPAP